MKSRGSTNSCFSQIRAARKKVELMKISPQEEIKDILKDLADLGRKKNKLRRRLTIARAKL